MKFLHVPCRQKADIMSTLKLLHLLLLFFTYTGFAPVRIPAESNSADFVSYIADPAAGSIKMYWKDDKGSFLKNAGGLKTYLAAKKEKLLFAMNAGIYQTNYVPLGLYIQEFKVHRKLNTRTGYGNFYMKPNGVFYITNDNKAGIKETASFKNNAKIKYATQSGPMLLTDGVINSQFTKNSKNINIRNGVGILPDGKVLFVISTAWVNFYDFAKYFKDQGCKEALYLDGAISAMYCPEKGMQQTGGDFAVLIGVSEAVKK